jgi:acyl-coenzyme A thioesterase 9
LRRAQSRSDETPRNRAFAGHGSGGTPKPEPRNDDDDDDDDDSSETSTAQSSQSPAPQIQFEAYHGARRAEDIAAYVHEALDETLAEADERHERSYDDEEGKARASAAGKRAAKAAGAQKVLGGGVRTSGCVIDGSVRVNRVPGSLYVTPHSAGHAINSELVNMTHVIKHFSFGKHVPGGRPSFVPRALRNTWSRVPKDMGGRFAAAPERSRASSSSETSSKRGKKKIPNEKETSALFAAASSGESAALKNPNDHDTFISDAPFTVHEHHLNVVGRTFEPLEGPRSAVRLYEYTFNSNRFVLEPPFDEDDARIDGAAIKFAFDISPMRVVLRETKKPILDWTLGVCALVGGVYTCSGLLTSLLETGAREVKRRIGKHA